VRKLFEVGEFASRCDLFRWGSPEMDLLVHGLLFEVVDREWNSAAQR
jgi:hypothetical protein